MNNHELIKFKYLAILFLFFSCDLKGKESANSLIKSELEKKAQFYYKNKDYLVAKKYFDTLLLKEPTNGEYYYKRAYSNYMLLNYDNEAISDFMNSIKYNYKNQKGAYLTIGTIYRIHGKLDSALSFYNKALIIDSSYEKAKSEKKEVLKIIEKLK